MAVNIHTDPKFEKQLTWLSRRLQKNKTQILKELVEEKYQSQRQGFRRGALRQYRGDLTVEQIVAELKEIGKDKDYDLDRR